MNAPTQVPPDESSSPSRHMIQSHVWAPGERCYFVSSIDRECSSPFAYGGRYVETLVWRWERGTRTDLIYTGEGPKEHFRVCEFLMKHGEEGLDHE